MYTEPLVKGGVDPVRGLYTSSQTLVFLRTFAYKTVKDRMPLILTQVVDSFHKLEPTVRKSHGDVSGIATRFLYR